MKLPLIRGKTPARFSPKMVIDNPNGEVRKYLGSNPGDATCFKEVYFSRILPGKSKKWKCNMNQTQNLTTAVGRISVICVQMGIEGYFFEEFLIDEERNFGVLEIPAGVIYGIFTDMQGALIVNSLKEAYSDSDAIIVTENFDLEPSLL